MTNTFIKTAHQTQWIAVKNLSVVWSKSQREFNERHADRIASDFDPDLFDDLVVTLPNGNGIYHVVDGQHRKAAIQKLWGEDEQVPCRIVQATDPARAAAIFDKINTGRKTPTGVEKFNVRVTAGYETEADIHKMVTFMGYRISNAVEEGTIRAVSAMLNVYKAFGREVLKEALMTIKCTWDKDPHAVDGPIIEGYGALIAEHRGHLDWPRLRKEIGQKYTPGRLLGHAKADKEVHGGTTGQAICRVLIRAYDNGLRKGKLSS